MIRVKIKHITSAEPSNYLDFATPEEASKYIEEMKASEHWGKSEKHWVEKDENGNDVDKHQTAEVEFITEDVTAEHEAKNQKKADHMARIEALKALDLSKVTTIAQIKPVLAVLIKEVLDGEL